MSRTEAIPAIPPTALEVLREILDQLQVAEDEAKAGIGRDDTEASPSFVAGYLSAIIRTQAGRLERLLDFYAPKDAG